MIEPQPHVENPVHQPEFERDFVLIIQNLFHLLERPAPEGWKRSLGPCYHVRKQERVLDCYIVRRDRLAQDEHVMDIVAISSNDLPVAHSHVILKRQGGRLIAENEIITGIRDAGFALSPLLVFFDLMQREANKLNEDIIIEEKDQHLKTIRYYQDLLDTNISLQLIQQCEKKIEQLRSERARWIALFGPSGKLGYDRNQCKYIQSQSLGRCIDNVDDITLDARLENGVPVVLEEVTLANGDTRKQQKQRYDDLLVILQNVTKKPNFREKTVNQVSV